jgi:hypothetical protein
VYPQQTTGYLQLQLPTCCLLATQKKTTQKIVVLGETIPDSDIG